MRLTFKDAKNSRLPKVLGICGDSDEFAEYLNEATERLLFRGKWKGSFQEVRLCLSDGCVTLPRQIESITDVSLCNQPIAIRNQFFEFLSNGDGVLPNSGCSPGCSGPQLIDRGWYPLFSDIRGTNKQLKFYPTITADAGKLIHVFGQDENGAWIRSASGSSQIDGVKVTIADPFVQMTFDIKAVTGLQKEETQGSILIYEVDTVTSIERLVGRMEPSETVASYRRYFLSGFDFNLTDSSCGCGDTNKTVMAMAKLAFIPVSEDSDYLFIDNLPALKEMCQSIRFGEMDTPVAEAQSLMKEKRAIRELNHQKQSLNGNDTIAIGMKVFGSAGLNRRRVGRLI